MIYNIKMQRIKNNFPGLILTLSLVFLTLILSSKISINSTLLAIVIGFSIRNILPISDKFTAGINSSESYGLGLAVALLGLQINLTVLMQIDFQTLLLVILSVFMTFLTTFVVAKWLKVSKQEAILVASGQGICGSAAIMATQKVSFSPKLAAAQIVVFVNLLGFIGIFFFSWLLTYILTQPTEYNGVLVGNTLQSMGHVVAAGFSINDDVGHLAVLVKMCRIILLIPLLFILIITFRKRRNEQQSGNTGKFNFFELMGLIPWFIWGFLLFVVVNQFELIDTNVKDFFSKAGQFFFVLAMVAIGLCINIKEVFKNGGKLLALCMAVFGFQILFSGTLLLYLY